MRPLRDLEPGTIDAIYVLAVGHNTKLSNPQFEITLPGVWTQNDQGERVMFVDATATVQLFISKLQLKRAPSASTMQWLLMDYAERKQKIMTDVSKGVAVFSEPDFTFAGDELELRYHAFDASKQVSCYTVFRAKLEAVYDFTVYQYGQTQLDQASLAGYQAVFNSIKIK